MRRALPGLIAVLALSGCGLTSSVDPYSATCREVKDLSSLDSIAAALVEDVKPPGNQDTARGEFAVFIEQECEGKPTTHKPAKGAVKTARKKLDF